MHWTLERFFATGSTSDMFALLPLITIAACAGSVLADMKAAPRPVHSIEAIQSLRMERLLFCGNIPTLAISDACAGRLPFKILGLRTQRHTERELTEHAAF